MRTTSLNSLNWNPSHGWYKFANGLLASLKHTFALHCFHNAKNNNLFIWKCDCSYIFDSLQRVVFSKRTKSPGKCFTPQTVESSDVFVRWVKLFFECWVQPSKHFYFSLVSLIFVTYPPNQTQNLNKAFLCIPHDILIRKLQTYGSENASVNFLRSYITCRYLSKNGYTSKISPINMVSPQGSVLSPILSLIFTNSSQRVALLLHICLKKFDKTSLS